MFIDRKRGNMVFDILKSQPDKMLVFGWASIAQHPNGEFVADMQGDVIDPEALEEAAYEYVLDFRDTGVEHQDSLRKKGKLVESVVLTKEKMDAMGIPSGIVPIGWWVGFKIHDQATWELIKKGKLKMFSIQGQGSRKAIEKSVPYLDFNESFSSNVAIDGKEKKVAENPISEVLRKFNPYHDYSGKFTSGIGGGAVKITVKPPSIRRNKIGMARNISVIASGIVPDTERNTDKISLRLESKKVAKEMHQRATEAEPAITEFVKKIANESGGVLTCLDSCVKDEKSISEKIERFMSDDRSRGKNTTVEQAASEIKDYNRYTMLSGEETIVDTVIKTMNAMEDEGYTCEWKRCSFAKGESYMGVNTIYKSKDGSYVEIQFHTQKSLEVKNKNHKLYEISRLPDVSQNKKESLEEQMKVNLETVIIPENIQELFDDGFVVKSINLGVNEMDSNDIYSREYFYGKSIDNNGIYDIIVQKEGGIFGKPKVFSRLKPEGEIDERYAFCQEEVEFDRVEEDEAKKWLAVFIEERIDDK